MWLNELWQHFMGPAPRQLRRRCRKSRTRTRLTLEALEERTLLSNPSTAGELITAINKANSSGTPQTITLAAGATFNFTQADNPTNGGNALPIITGNITIVGNSDILVRTGTAAYRLFDVASGGSLNLQNLTLQGGRVQGAGAGAEGGAVFSSGTLKLSGVTVQNNAAVGSNGLNAPTGGGTQGTGGAGANAFGGGLYVTGGSVSLDNDILSGNLAQGGNGGHGSNVQTGKGGIGGGGGGSAAGGGLYVAGGSFSLSNDTFINNRVIGGEGGGGGKAHYGTGGDGGADGAGAGGGLYVGAADSLTLSNDTFSGNEAAAGSSGGIAGSGSVAGKGGNGAEGAGGGLYVAAAGSLTLSQDTLSNNYAAGGSGGRGGNGHGFDSLTLGQPGGAGGDGASGYGGGLYVGNGTLILVNDTIAGNSVLGGYGGPGGNGGNGGTFAVQAYSGGAGGAGGAAGAGAGGGLYVDQGSVTLLNDTLSGNLAQGEAGGNGGNGGNGGVFAGFISANGGNGGNGGAGGDAQGGGLYVPAFNVTYSLANTLIAENNLVDGTGGAGGKAGGGNGSPTNGANGSNGTAIGPDVAGTVISSDHDLIGESDGSSGFSTANGDRMGTIANPLNPQLGPLQNNGGPTQTMALLAGSPAIDKGDNSALHGLKTDQRGFPRIVNGGISDTVDIGAYEFGSIAGMAIQGTQLVIIGDVPGTNANDSATIEVNASGGVEAVLDGVTDNFNPGQVTSIFLALGGGSNTITLLGTPSGVTTDIVSGGSDTVTLGNGTTQTILGTVNIENPLASTNLIVDDSADTHARTVTLSNIGANPADAEGDSDPWEEITGLLGRGYIFYEIPDTASVTIDGSDGASTYNIQNTDVATTINGGAGSDKFNVGSGSLTSIQAALTVNGGGGTNTLNANDQGSVSGQSYTLSATQLAGSDFAPITYASLHAINFDADSSGNDTLTLLSPTPFVATTFDAGGGSNTLVGPNVTNTIWTITGPGSGRVDSVSFSNVRNLVGGVGSDSFDFSTSSAYLPGSITGGSGSNTNNTLSYATLGSSFRVTATLTSNTTGVATHIYGGFSNINYLIGSTDTANTLTGPNGTNEWIITGNNAGYVNTGATTLFGFSHMGNLVGGTGVDTFRMHSTSSKLHSLNGGGAPAGQGDWLKYSEFPSSSTVSVNLATGSATNIDGGAAGSVKNIQNVLGTATGTNKLTGDAQGNILIGGSGANTIVGGSGSSLLIGGSGHGSITGGSGEDILIAGFTTYSPLSAAGVDALMAILAELQSSDSFAHKVSDITNGNASGGGSDLNGSNKLTWGGTVRASTGAFTLSGDTSVSSAADWFFSQSPSTVSDFNDDGVNDEHNNNAIGVF